MRERCSLEAARRLVMEAAALVGTEEVPLSLCAGRVLAQDVTAVMDVPPFDRSPYDGYALRAQDTAAASPDAPAVLRVLEDLPAGTLPKYEMMPGTAVQVATGAPVPPGADAVVPYERTEAGPGWVRVSCPVPSGANVVRAGEDLPQGVLLARRGTVVDPSLLGVLASQGWERVQTVRRPRVGILSTGGELLDVGEPLTPGKIYNTSRYTLWAALSALGCEPVWLGRAEDQTEAIAALLERGLASCDALVSTGGVSVGEHDLTPAAMERAGVTFLFRGVACKPGMACAFGVRDGKLLCALSGNPVSALSSFHMLAAPALRALAGRSSPAPFPVALQTPFPKASPVTRLLWGRLELSGGRAELRLSPRQGNAMLWGTVGCDTIAEVPAGSGPLAAGTILRGWRL